MLYGMTGLLLLSAVVLSGCSDTSDTGQNGFVDRVLDSITVAVAENVQPVEPNEIKQDEPPETTVVSATPGFPASELTGITDLEVVGDVIYAVSKEGLIKYNLKEKETQLVPSSDALNTIALYGDEVFVGGDNLYRLESDTLATIETGLTGIVTVLYSDGPVLMVGTTHGLYARTEFGTVGLVDDIEVSALVRDHDGLWVGTNGQGLFRYDGEVFVKRYLKRDPSLLDVITTLAFNHNHLYVGTPDAFFIYDGGRWQEMTPDDGLPSGNVRSIDASGWVIYVATDRGVVSWYDGRLLPVAHLEQQPAELVRADRQRLLIGTSSEGLLVRSGPVLKPLVNRLPRRETGIASLEH